MEQQNNFIKVVASNLVKYRKMSRFTQLEIAEKINYSDKAVSKWERGESLPDIYVLKQLADIYGINVDGFLSQTPQVQKVPFSLKTAFKNKHFIITSLSAGLVWLIACIVFVTLTLLNFNKSYLAFIYAIPVSSIVCLVLSSIWAKKIICAIFATIVIWSTLLSIYLSISQHNLWLIFIVGVPLQIIVVLWYFLIKETTKIKRHLKNEQVEIVNSETKNVL